MSSPPDTAVAAARQAFDDVLAVPKTTIRDLGWFYDPTGNYAGSVFDNRDRTQTTSLPTTFWPSRRCRCKQVRGQSAISSDPESRGATLDALRVTDDVPLWMASSEQLVAAARLYRIVKSTFSAGDMCVSAGKLCARKRPQLIPVRDRAIVRGLKLPGRDFTADWLIIQSLFDHDVRQELRRCAIETNPAGGKLASVAELRLLDVALWMRWSRSRKHMAATSRVGRT